MMLPMQKDQLNLLEDGLQLWLVALRNAPEANPQLLDLFPNLAFAMESSTGILPRTPFRPAQSPVLF